jgi:hypothetical protein
LEALLGRRKAVLQDFRRPRASSIISDPDGPDRQSGGT